MSYILHAWEQPGGSKAPSTPTEAAAFIRIASRINPGLNPRFIAFAQALTAVYPDLDHLDDGDEENIGVWTDSPVNGQTENAIYTLGVLSNRLDSDLLWHVVHAASDHGLHLFDPQYPALFLPDLTYIDGGECLAVSKLARPHQPTLAWEDPAGCVAQTISGKTIREAAYQVIELIPRFHAPADFMHFVPEPVRKRARELTETLPANAEAVPILFSAAFDSRGMTPEEIEEKRERFQRDRKIQIFRAMTAVHHYFNG